MTYDLFSHAEACRRKERGMEKALNAERSCAPGFAEIAYAAIERLAQQQAEIHIDDFLRVCSAKPSHPNSMGSIWQKAIRNGVIEKTGRTRPCTTDPIKNAHDYPIYRSLRFRGQQSAA